MRSAVVVTLVMLSFAACAGRGEWDGARTESRLVVENHHPDNVRLYLVHNGMRQRVATLTRMGTHSIDLTPWLSRLSSGDVVFEVQPFGAREGYLLPAISIGHGDWLRMVVRSRPHQSAIWKTS